MRAFDEISDVRALTRQGRRMDGELLRRLWPGGCPPEQVAALLGAVTGPPASDVLNWLSAQIGAAIARGMLDAGSRQLALALADHPVLPLLPQRYQRAIKDAARVEPLLREAEVAVRRGDVTVFADLYAAYAAVDADGRKLLETRLPSLLAQAHPLRGALHDCPERVAVAFCRVGRPRSAARQPGPLGAPAVQGQPVPVRRRGDDRDRHPPVHRDAAALDAGR